MNSQYEFSFLKNAAVISGTLLLASCAPLPTVSDQSAKVDAQAIADMPVDAAIDALNRFQPAVQGLPLTATLRDNLTRYRCHFSGGKTQFPEPKAIIPNGKLHYRMQRVTINDNLRRMGMQNGVGVRVEQQDRSTDNSLAPFCNVAFFPDGYPQADLTRELNRLATAFSAIGIRRKSE